MKAKISITFALVGLFFAQTSIACDEPSNVSIPDGKKVTADEMSDAGQQFHQFMLNMQLYQVCLEDEANQERSKPGNPSKSAIQARENKYVSSHNAASDAMTKTAEGFRQAVADYEAKQ